MRYFYTIVLAFLFFTSCSSINTSKDIYVPIDYTEQDAVNNEKKRINEIKQDFPVKALWRSYLLNDSETIIDNEENVFELLKKYKDKNIIIFHSREEANEYIKKDR